MTLFPPTFAPLFLFSLLFTPTTAVRTDERWSDAYENPIYYTLPPCAKTCIDTVDDYLKCWSYGCVCSDNSPGPNYLNGTNHVQECARANCIGLGEAIVNNTLSSFESTCAVQIPDLGGGGSPTESAPAAQSSATEPVPPKPLIIDKPETTYLDRRLPSCVRWVLNGCASPLDTADNCQRPDIDPSSGGQTWGGLAANLSCQTTECMCGVSAPGFTSSVQTLYDRAALYCGLEIPYQGNDTDTPFAAAIEILSGFCSARGFVLEKWSVTIIGYVPVKEEKGMSDELKVTIAATVGSSLGTIVTLVIAYKTLRRTPPLDRGSVSTVSDRRAGCRFVCLG